MFNAKNTITMIFMSFLLALTGCVSSTKNADYQYSHSKPYDGFSGVKSMGGGNNKTDQTTPSTK